MSTDNRTTKVPTNVTNRRLVSKLEEWGWYLHRRRGNQWEMRSNYHASARLLVMAPHYHAGNDASTLDACYRIVADGKATVFWDGPPEPMPATKPPTLTQKVPTVPQDLIIQGGKAPAGAQVPTPTAQATPPSPPALPTTARRATAHRGATSKALAYLAAHPHETHTAASLAPHLGFTEGTTSSALARLAELGHAVRLVRGTYRLAATVAPDATVHHTHTGIQPAASPPPSPPPEVATPAGVPILLDAEQHAAPAPPPAATADEILELLELLLPDGYQFKPRHLAPIESWLAATRTLLATLTEGAT